MISARNFKAQDLSAPISSAQIFPREALQRAADGERYNWRCIDHACTVRKETMGLDGVPQPRGAAQHTHAPNANDCVTRKAVSSLKTLAKSTSRPVTEIYDQVDVATHEEHPAATPELPIISSVKSSPYRARREPYLPLPQEVADLEELPPLFTVIGQNRFMVKNTLYVGEEGSLIFATDACFRLLSKHRDWFMDGTFKVVPNMFRQLFTLHTMRDRKLLPCVNVLMRSKRRGAYCRVFRELKDSAEQYGLPPLNPATCMSDFEQGMIAGFADEFSAAESKGCLFLLSSTDGIAIPAGRPGHSRLRFVGGDRL